MQSTIIFLLVISVLVFVHELGHFLLAKFFGVGVKSFAIGFPPTLAKWKRGETTYKLNLLPFGGYVSLVGEVGQNADDDRQFAKHQFMNSKPWWQKLIILVAGITFNFIFALIIMIVLKMGQDGISGIISGFQLYIQLSGEIVRGLITFLAGLFNGAGLSQVSGPIGIAGILKQAAQVSFSQVAFLTAVLSINLGVLNFVPFPALDGGQMAIVFIEKIIGRPLPERVLTWVNLTGFVLIIALMIFVSVHDVKGIIK